MTISTQAPEQGTSTRPYLIRALHEWCTDNGFTPYLAVFVDGSVQVPREHVKNNEIVLNVAYDATSALQLGAEFIEFKARFGGVARDIVVPVDHVIAIYARENGQGMAFPVPATVAIDSTPPTRQGEAPVGKAGFKLTSVPDESPQVPSQEGGATPDAGSERPDPTDTPPPAGPRPSLRRIK